LAGCAPGELRCEIVPLERVYELAFELASQIRRSAFEPDLVVAIARGGFVPSRLVCDFLGVQVLTSVSIRHYGAGARAKGTARVQHPLTADVRGLRVLVVDDVNDSGETLAAARVHIERSGPRELRCAVLHEKTSTCAAADFRGEIVERWHWLVYQWALVEDAIGFLERLRPPAASAEDAMARLDAEFGLSLTQAQWQKVRACMPPSALRAGSG
jgi:hypoxanthine phosphoribosyltransferase